MSTEATSCEVNVSLSEAVSYEEAVAAYGDRNWWVSFFVRPCCPPPGKETATKQLDKQRDLVREREDFTNEQKMHLLSLIDEGEAWYRSTPYWAKGN